MLFKKLTYLLVFAVLLVVGLAFITTPAAEAVTPVLLVPDADAVTDGIQVYGIRDETVTFELTITFQDNPTAATPVNTSVTGFDVTDIQLTAADSNGRIVSPGATASPVRPNLDGSMYATTLTANDNVNTILIDVPERAASTLGRVDPQNNFAVEGQEDTAEAIRLVVHIVRSTAPPLTLSEDRSISGTAPFRVTLTSTEAITLTDADIKITGGSIDSLSPDTARKVWTVTIRPGVGVTEVTVAAVDNGAYIFPKGTFTIDTAGPGPGVGTGPPLGVIFSEIANRNNNANEWIEFKNRTASPHDVGGWIVSIVTGVNSDAFLFSLPDVTIPAGGILLVTDRDPEDAGSSLAKDSPLWREVNIGALPNEGNFMLVLRNSSNRALLGTVNQIVDVAGYFPNAAQAAALIGQSAPSAKNNLRANKVYWRQHENIVGTSSKGAADADAAFQPIGYTGVGYERAASQTDENGGTPGWPNDVRKGSVTELTGDVTISEIMYVTNGSSDEIQWIELYNSSKTEAIALDDNNGWGLIIDNYDDPDSTDEPLSGEINFKDNGNVKTILPNQTVLIVSSRGRNSDRNHFPSSRVFDVYAEVGNEFDMDSRRDPFLNPTEGFRIELVDGRGGIADEVGNLDWRTRLTDEPVWQLPKGRTESGDRTSIIRQYRDYNPRNGRYSNEGEVHDGTEREGWIPAHRTAFRGFTRNRKTWYGSDTDHGSPGLLAGQALPVQLSHFRPERTGTGAIVIHWTTQSEVDNAGFNILRSQTKTGAFKVVNAQMILGAGTKAESTTYTWTDTTAKSNVVYYYQIEDVSFAGERQTLATVRLRGLISAKDKLTTQWGELKQSRD